MTSKRFGDIRKQLRDNNKQFAERMRDNNQHFVRSIHSTPKTRWWNKKWVKVLIASFILIAIISVFTDPNESKNSGKVPDQNKTNQQAATNNKTEPEIKYTLTATAKSLNQDTLEVSGKTNLPNDAVLSVEIERVAIWSNETEERFIRIATSNLTVRDSKFSGRVKIDDKKFLEYAKAFYQSDSNDIVRKLDPKVEISVIFDPQAEGQPQSVIDKVGRNGEKLENSPQKDVFGSMTSNPRNRLEVEFRTPFTFLYTDQLPR